jgi:hypothetical protein
MKGDKLAPGVKAALIAFTGTHANAAKACGVAVSTAQGIRLEAGVCGRENRTYTADEIATIARMRAEGASVSAVARVLGRTRKSVEQRFYDASMRRHAPPDPWVQRALAAYAKTGYGGKK